MRANPARAFLCILGVLALCPVATPSQMCTGSHIIYVVRDAQGSPVDLNTVLDILDGLARPVDVQSTEFTLTAGGGGAKWRADNLSNFARLIPEATLASLKGKSSALEMYPAPWFCEFEKPVELNVTRHGRTMSLTFLTPMPGNGSRNFIVDGLPFQEGRFEITLSKSVFYPASGWTKK